MTSKAKHMRRSKRSHKDASFQNAFKRRAWVREYDEGLKEGFVERVRNFLKSAAGKTRKEKAKPEEE